MSPEEYDYNSITFSYNLKCPYTSFSDVKKDVENVIGEHFYIYKENYTLGGALGTAELMTRSVTINKNITENWKLYEYYTYALAHELIHIKYICGDETYTNYLAITILYESDNDYFRNVALWWSDLIIRDHDGNEYDCGKQLIEYFGVTNE